MLRVCGIIPCLCSSKNGPVYRVAAVAALFIGISAVSLSAFEPLPRAEPEQLGINAGLLEQAMDSFAGVEGLWAVVVVRNGNLVAESYFQGGPEELHPVWSVTKSITSTLVGMALDRRLFPDLDVLMSDYLPPEFEAADPAADNISLEHLLMMTSGLEWSEEDDWIPWVYSLNPGRFILNRSVVTNPGMEFNYSSASSHLPSLMLSEILHEAPDEFAGNELFHALGISDWSWERDPQGYPFGGHGVKLRTEDLAKIGILFMKRGWWHGRQVISTSWIDEATRPRFFWGIDYGPLEDVDYGYLWWTGVAGDYPVFIAWGWGGQFAFCVPDLGLVVATAADGWVEQEQADAQEIAILNVIVEEVLPSMRPLREVKNPIRYFSAIR